jgi:predicted MFS family arabinose efflux permease
MYCEVSGPTLIDLKHRFKAGYEELAVALSAGGAGTIPGCILGGILVDKFGAYCHLMIAVTLDIAAICVVLMPWVPTLLYLWTLCFISGLVETIHNTGKF